jgi:NAD(P)-dependent dehydrogenase (short-subunit alcohol dehydrogenase family)
MTGASLAGRRAVVTGGGGGVGQGIANRLAQAGAEVVVADFDVALGQSAVDALIARGEKARFLPVHVTDKASLLDMLKEAGPTDILVNNAWRGSGQQRVENKTDAQMESALLFGPYAAHWAMTAVFPHMRAQGWGRIISIASLNGVNAHIGTADYNMAKEALRALTRTAAREWAPYGICCNIICPAAMAESTRKVMAAQPGMIERISAANPMGRLGDPDADIGGVALFLASEDARYVTGNTIFADGGGHINGVAWAPQLDD